MFNGVVPFDGGKWKFCIFEEMQLSHDGSVLYLVSPVYATSGSLAIVTLSTGNISDEFFTVGGHDKVLILRQYLRRIGGTIILKNGETLP